MTAQHHGSTNRGAPAPEGRSQQELDARTLALRALTDDGVPYMVGGAYAFFEYTGIYRDTKDLDVFLMREDVPTAFAALEREGFRTELTDDVWIAKGFMGEYFIDLIFSSGNGVATVDRAWFDNAPRGMALGVPCLLIPPEEMIWSKGFVNERERFDGADVNHVIHACGERMDWRRLMARFERYWEVLFAHLMFYRFAYPFARDRVPAWVVTELCERTQRDLRSGDLAAPICRGNLISRVQYRHDYEHHGYEDGRAWDERDRGAR